MDNSKRLIYFICGAILGLLFGAGLWGGFLLDAQHGWLAIPLGGLLFGILSACFGEEFWESILRHFAGWF